MNSLQLFANTEEESEINKIANSRYNFFNIRSIWFPTPIRSETTKEVSNQKETTKFLLLSQTMPIKLLDYKNLFLI